MELRGIGVCDFIPLHRISHFKLTNHEGVGSNNLLIFLREPTDSLSGEISTRAEEGGSLKITALAAGSGWRRRSTGFMEIRG